jgi:hypothetical protein
MTAVILPWRVLNPDALEEKVKSNKILHIHYYFPPVGTVGSLRNYCFARELSGHFEDSHLITLRKKPLLMQESLSVGFTRIHEVNNFDYRNLYEKTELTKDLNDQINANKSKKGPGLFAKILESYPGNILWGEGGMIYVFSAIIKAKQLIREEGITHIYSSFRPFADHYIAYRLKKAFPQLCWIADFRDLPVDKNRKNVFLPGSTDKLYRRFFSKADILTTVSEGLRKRLLDYNDRVLLMRNGSHGLFIPDKMAEPEKFTISYTGSLYPGYQKTEALFLAIDSLIREKKIDQEKIELVYAGKDRRIWLADVQKHKLGGISSIYGKVSLTESVKLQHKSHVNVMLTWNGPHTGGIITGKFSEYLTAEKPILCLINGDREPELEEIFMKMSQSAVFYTEDIDEMANWLLRLYEKWTKGIQVKEAKSTTESWPRSVEMLRAQLRF